MGTRIAGALVAALLIGWPLPGGGETTMRGIGIVKKEQSTSPIGGTSRALLIGNNDYQWKKWPSLKTAVHDVEELGKVLSVRYGFAPENLRVLRNASRREMLKGFRDLAEEAKPEDSVFIYYAGHGEYDKDQRGWWVPVDAQDSVDYISNDDLLGSLRTIKARHKLLVADSCFSGNILTRGAATKPDLNIPVTGYFLEKSKLAAVQGLTSGGNEPVSDGGPQWNGHSIFAYHLIAKLKANQRPYLAASFLGYQLSEVVANDTATLIGNSQTPVFSAIKNQGDQGGEFFFIPVDIGARPGVQVALFLVKPSDARLAAAIGKAGAAIQGELLKRMEAQNIKPVGAVEQVERQELEGAVAAKLRDAKVPNAIVIDLAPDMKREATLLWQGWTQLDLTLYGFRAAEGRLTRLANQKVEPQRLPMRRWSAEPAAVEEQLDKTAEKVLARWSKPGLNEFLLQFAP
ncbi:MAG: caspase family protein [Candidatus Lambdaproteobacteria bacterium]|nr:caspase family protein [Candidatus Lambdaproteobacteria bacterium]